MDKQTTVEEVQKAAKVLKETIEKYLGEAAVVKWGVKTETDYTAGFALTTGMDRSDLAQILYTMDEVQYSHIKFKE